LKFWAIGFLAIVTCVVILIKRNLERKIVNESS
jgi:hypothetical protein